MLKPTLSHDREEFLHGSVAAEELGFRSSLANVSRSFHDDQRNIMRDISEDSLPLISAIESLSDGGKRLRALFCYWGWRAAGGAPTSAVPVLAGAALEFFQTGILIHDDLIDRSDTRRGVPSMHRQFDALHAAALWRHGSDHFGNSAAVLAGDLCLAFSDELFTRAFETVPVAQPSLVLARMRTEVLTGQYLDLLEEAVGPARDPVVAEERALNVLRFKSAKYSTERPLSLGGALAKADAPLLARFADFALPLGEAFQLRDDILGVFGDPAVTGKPAGGDLREGKRTFLIARALRLSSPDVCRTLNSLLGRPALSDIEIERLQGIIEGSGALASAEDLIADKSRQALAVLDNMHIEAVPAKALRLLADAAVVRSA